MKTTVAAWVGLGTVVLVCGALLWAATEPGFPKAGFTQGLTPSPGWIVTSTVSDNRQQIVVADPAQQSLAVYHVDLATGRIALKSVRHIRFDLMMTEFNTESPSPGELEALLKSP